MMAVVAVVAGAGYGGSRLLRQPPPAADRPAPVPVVTAPVRQGDVPIVLDGIGTVQALNSAAIRSQVTGLLQSVNFTEGQAVHRGDLLAQVDPRPEQAALDGAKAQLARDAAHLANARANIARNLPLLREGYATDQQVAGEQSQISQLTSVLRSDQAAIDSAQAQLGYTALVAPFDGVTGVRTLDVGNVIQPGAAALVSVTQVQPIAVLFTLPSNDIPAVQDALAAGAVPAAAYDSAGRRRLDEGRLLLINNQADPNSGSVQLKALFPNPRRLLWPGTFVNVELTLRTVRGGLTVPDDAVQQGARGPFVFVVGADGRVATRQVQVAQRSRGTALLAAGLRPDETVVEQGQYRLVEGAAVTPASPAHVANPSPATAGLLP